MWFLWQEKRHKRLHTGSVSAYFANTGYYFIGLCAICRLFFINYTRENIVFYITRFSPDTLLRYDITVESNVTTGRVEKVNIPWSMSREKEEVIRCAAMNDIGDIEQMLKQMIRFRETIGSSHIYYFNGAINGNKVSKFDFKVAFNDKEGWQYYLLTHFRDEDDIPAEKIRVTERWCIEEIDPPDHR